MNYVENALDILEDGQRQIQKSVLSGTIEIGFVSSVQRYLMEMISQYQSTSPAEPCQFSLYEGRTGPMLMDLRKDKLDFILASDPQQDDEFEAIPIVKQEIFVIVSDNNILAQKVKLKPSELGAIPLILHTADTGMYGITNKILQSCGIHPYISGEASDDRTVVSMVALGLGAAIVTESEDIHRKGISILSLDYEFNYRYVYQIYRKSHYIQPWVRNFIKYISSNCYKS